MWKNDHIMLSSAFFTFFQNGFSKVFFGLKEILFGINHFSRKISTPWRKPTVDKSEYLYYCLGAERCSITKKNIKWCVVYLEDTLTNTPLFCFPALRSSTVQLGFTIIWGGAEFEIPDSDSPFESLSKTNSESAACPKHRQLGFLAYFWI